MTDRVIRADKKIPRIAMKQRDRADDFAFRLIESAVKRRGGGAD